MNVLFPDLRRWDVVITAPGCPRDPVIPEGVSAVLEKAAAAARASDVMSAWSADRTVFSMTVRAEDAAAARAAALGVVKDACGTVIDVAKASVAADPGWRGVFIIPAGSRAPRMYLAPPW